MGQHQRLAPLPHRLIATSWGDVLLTHLRFGRCGLVAAFLLALSSSSAFAALPRIGIAGEYPSGYNGLLARQGIPRRVLLDYEIMDAALIRRLDLLLVAQLHPGMEADGLQAILEYVREGGTAVLDAGTMPPETLAPGARGRLKRPPGIVIGGGADNPLVALLGEDRRLPPSPWTSYIDPGADPEVRILARFDARYSSSDAGTPALGYTGTPAIWEKKVGRGRLVYSGPGIGFSLALNGSELEPLAEALIHYLTGGKAQPQLVPEGRRFARKESAITLGLTDVPAPVEETPVEVWPAIRARPAWPAGPLPARAAPLEEDSDSTEYNLSGSYLPDRGSAEFLLDYWNSSTCITLAFERQRARLTRTENGKVAAKAVVSLPLAKDVPFVLKMRRDMVTLLMAGQTRGFPLPTRWEGKNARRGMAFADLRCQPIEPVYFTDDFMRTNAERGAWEAISGLWSTAAEQNPGMGANPFAYSARATGPGYATSGYPFWEEYRFEASVRPGSGEGALGLCLYYQDQQNHYLLRARCRPKREPLPDGLQLVVVKGGKERVLAQGAGCLVHGQWYRVSLQVRGRTLTAAVDGAPLLRAEDSTFSSGMVALHVRDVSARFDDVCVQPSVAVARPEVVLDGGTPRYAGAIDVDSWAAPSTQWEPDAEMPGLFRRHGRFYNDVKLAFRIRPFETPAANGNSTLPLPTQNWTTAPDAPRGLTLILDGDGPPRESGYALVLRPGTPSGDGRAAYQVELFRQGKVVARADAAASHTPEVALQRQGRRIVGLLDGRAVVEVADADPPVGAMRLGFLAEGFLPRLSGLRVQAVHVLDDTFDEAPVDWWVGSGSWELSNRWSCTPDWSWFGGISSDVAAIWYKRQFASDVAVDFYVGPRMVDRGQDRPKELCHDFNAVLCGDGADVMTGYTFVAGAGEDAITAKLLRRGQVVATNEAFRTYTVAHNRWFRMRAERRGAEVSLWMEDTRVLSWTDSDPLPDGYAGIWTRDNGIMIPRVTLYYREIGPGVLSVNK